MTKKKKIILTLIAAIILLSLGANLNRFIHCKKYNKWLKGSINESIGNLSSTDENAVLKAMRFLEVAGKQAVPSLIDVLGEENERARIIIIELLAVTKDNRAVAPLIDLLDDDNWRIRFFAAQALGRIGDKRAVEPLSKLWLDEDNWQVQHEIAIALSRIGDKRAVPDLLTKYESKDIRIHLSATIALYGITGTEKYFKDIEKILHNENPAIRRVTILILGNWGDSRAMPLLKEALHDEDLSVRKIAQESIKEIQDNIW